MAATKFSDYLGPKYYKKTKKLKHFIHLRLANRPQSLSTYHSIVNANKTLFYITGTYFFRQWPEFTAGDILWYVLKL